MKSFILISIAVPFIASSIFSIDDDVILFSTITQKTPEHENTACNTCHKMRADMSQATDYQYEINSNCIGCHKMDEKHNSNLSLHFHTNQDKICIDCHSYHSTSTLKVNDVSFEYIQSERSVYICQSCHSDETSLENLSNGHYSAKDYYHSELINSESIFPSESCQSCHGTEHRPIINEKTPSFINLNTSHPINISIINSHKFKKQIDQRIPLFNNEIECQSCHLLSSGTEHSLIDFDNKIDLCLGCHSLKD